MDKKDDYILDQIKRYSKAQRRVEEKQYRAAIDGSTSLFKRKVAEDYLRLQLAENKPLTVVLIVFDAVPRPGEEGLPDRSDCVLEGIGRTLAEYLGAFEMICRWDEDSFLLVSSGERNAEEALGAIQARIRCSPRGAGVPADPISIHPRLGLARSVVGDSVADVIARAEAVIESSRSARQLPSA